MTLRTKLQEGQVALFVSEAPNDPHSGSHVVITAINPATLIMGEREHYRIYAPGFDIESYAYADELTPKGD